jgi:hypothetical protein
MSSEINEDENSKKNLKRKKNPEENSFCLWNIFYIFFLRYVWRIKALSDKDIPECDSRDVAKLMHDKINEPWKKRYSEYSKEYEIYEKEKNRNPRFLFWRSRKIIIFFLIFFLYFEISLV